MSSSYKDLSVSFGLTPCRLAKLAFLAIGIFAAANTSSLGQYLGLSAAPECVVAMAQSSADAPVPAPQVQHDAAMSEKESFLEQASRFEHDTLRLNKDHFDFSNDWWKYCIMLLVLSVSLFFIVKAGTALVRLFCFAFCLAFSTLASYIFAPMLAPVIAEHFSELALRNCPPLYWAYLVIFLAAYLFASLIVLIMKKPIKPAVKVKE